MIPQRVKKLLRNDERMTKCERCGASPVEWHHVYQYAGKQIQEYFNIAAACKKCHDKATPHKNGYKQEIREYFEWKALQRMTDEDIKKYWKKDWGLLVRYLTNRAKEYGWD